MTILPLLPSLPQSFLPTPNSEEPKKKSELPIKEAILAKLIAERNPPTPTPTPGFFKKVRNYISELFSPNPYCPPTPSATKEK
jgi:hypothetical protein